jgi:hypothetical protein
MWKQVAKEIAQGPNPTVQQVVHHHHNSSSTSTAHAATPPSHHPEDILVKIEPHQLMTNGEDNESGSSRNATNDGFMLGVFILFPIINLYCFFYLYLLSGLICVSN